MNINTRIKIQHEIKKIFTSRIFTRGMYIFGGVLLAFVIFQAGVFVGFHKASFGRDWDDNYARNFGGPRHGMGRMMAFENAPNAHGTIGKIIKVDATSLIVEDIDKTEKVILITDQTLIRKMREEATKADLTVDANVVVIGTPNANGQIEAKFIRIMPELPMAPVQQQ